ncbi:retrovirus-related Pol polyprotein from transposon TNT 1-94, partial [Trifolium pratense]
EVEPQSVKAAMSDSGWLQAMQSEYKALMDNNTWSLVPLHLQLVVNGSSESKKIQMALSTNSRLDWWQRGFYKLLVLISLRHSLL